MTQVVAWSRSDSDGDISGGERTDDRPTDKPGGPGNENLHDKAVKREA